MYETGYERRKPRGLLAVADRHNRWLELDGIDGDCGDGSLRLTTQSTLCAYKGFDLIWCLAST